MNMRHVFSLAAILATACTFASSAHAGDDRDDRRPGGHGHPHQPDLSNVNVVLVHGAFADGSSWSKVIPLLRERGLHVVAVQNPESSLSADADAANRVIEQQSGPVVLVGHSWAGAVITEAGVNKKVKALVYVSAFAPDKGQSVYNLISPYPAPPWFDAIVLDSQNFMTLPEQNFLANFAPDLPKSEARILSTVQVPWAQRALFDPLTNAAWRTRPSTWVLSLEDQIIAPELQEQMASNIGASVLRIHSSHASLLSHPREVADAIIGTAEAVADK